LFEEGGRKSPFLCLFALYFAKKNAMRRWIFLSCLLVFCAVTKAQTNITINHNGVDRDVVYFVPSSYVQGQQLPLLIVLHGLTQTGPGIMAITGYNAIAEQNNFIVCYPSGLNNAWNADMNVTVSTADDKGFIEALALYFQSNFTSDPSRQYLCGFSNGGFMSHKMACESSMCFAAIATVSGNMSDTTYANCNPQFTPAVLHIHGTADLVVPYGGGAATGVSVDLAMEKWRTVLSCDANPAVVNMPNTSLIDLSSPQRYTYANCNSDLQHIKITGGGHQWPGIATLVGGAGTINMDFYSPQVIWDFLSGKSCPLNGLNDQSNTNTISIFPNPTTHALYIEKPGTWQFEIMDQFGKVQLSGNEQNEIRLSALDAGIYSIKVTDEVGSSVQRIVKIND
jgi:polyhydroxybutyrate depolymerase